MYLTKIKQFNPLAKYLQLKSNNMELILTITKNMTFLEEFRINM